MFEAVLLRTLAACNGLTCDSADDGKKFSTPGSLVILPSGVTITSFQHSHYSFFINFANIVS